MTRHMKKQGDRAFIADDHRQHVFDKEIYKARHLMENLFCKLKQYRTIAARYGQNSQKLVAAIHSVGAVIWLH